MSLIREKPSFMPETETETETETKAKVNRTIISVVSILVAVVLVCFICEFRGHLVRFWQLLVRLWGRLRKMIYTEATTELELS